MTKETKRIIQMMPSDGWVVSYRDIDGEMTTDYSERFLAFVLEETTEPGIDTFYSIGGIDTDGYTRVDDAVNFHCFRKAVE